MGIDQISSIDPASMGGDDVAHFWRDSRFGDLECLSARFRKHVYAPHTHDTYVIGLITECAETFDYQGAAHVAGAGQLVTLNPDELHDGRPVNEIYAYRMFYPSTEVVQRELEDMTGRSVGPTYFPQPVVDDPALAVRLLALHRTLESRRNRLKADSEFLACTALLALRHGERRPRVRRVGDESVRIGRVRAYLDAHYTEEVDLATLASLAGLSRFHLIRAFSKELSVTPHAYLMGRRVAAAKKRLSRGEALSETALACGFYDQSHFNRVFKAQVGVPPGAYRRGSNSVQDLRA